MTETEIPPPETQEVLEPTIEDMIQAEDGVPFTTSLAILLRHSARSTRMS